ncbi:MAG TPA: hypothetical protein VMW65_05110 [Chloroflexota bacterium]|nr:hypothetical protein [Chloroflexota bacterium]
MAIPARPDVAGHVQRVLRAALPDSDVAARVEANPARVALPGGDDQAAARIVDAGARVDQASIVRLSELL